MKIKLTQKQIQDILQDPARKLAAGIKTTDPWWVILLKVIAYAIGLILGGAITTSCAYAIGII